MAYNGSQWDENNPTNSTLANEIDDVSVDMKIGIRSRMSAEHVWPAAQTGTSEAGQHTYVSFSRQTAPPALPVVSAVTQGGLLFVGSSSLALSYVELAGTVRTLVTSGKGVTIIGAYYSSTGAQGDLLIGGAGGVSGVLAASATNLALISRSNTADPNWQPVLLLSNANTVSGLTTFATNANFGNNTLTAGFLGVNSQSSHNMSNNESFTVPAGFYVNGISRGPGGEVNVVFFARL